MCRFLSNLVPGDLAPGPFQWQMLKEKERAAQAMLEHAKQMEEMLQEKERMFLRIIQEKERINQKEEEMLQEKERMFLRTIQDMERIIQEKESRVQEKESLTKEKETVIREKDHRIRAQEFELLRSHGANNLRGLIEEFEKKFDEKYAEMLEVQMAESGRELSRQDRWSPFCRLDSALSQCFERTTGWHGHERQGAGVVQVYKILNAHVHEGKQLPVLQKLDGKTWAIAQDPLTFSQASAVACMAEVLGYRLMILSAPEKAEMMKSVNMAS